MRTYVILLSLIAFNYCLFGFVWAQPCDRTIEMYGKKWRYEKMEDGNQFHQLNIDKSYEPGEVLDLTLPCPGYVCDSLQIEWDDMRGGSRATLTSFPGEQNLGVRKVNSPKSREIWAINRVADRLLIEFSGDMKVKVFWVRLFYGKKMMRGETLSAEPEAPPPPPPPPPLVKGLESMITIRDAAPRRGNVIQYRDGTFIIEFSNPQRPGEKEEIPINRIVRIEFPKDQEWGSATSENHSIWTIKPLLYHDGLLDFVKRENVGDVTRRDQPIREFIVISFKTSPDGSGDTAPPPFKKFRKN